MRGTTSGVWHFPGPYLVSGNPHLGKLAEWDRPCTTQVGIVRVVLVPAAELVRLPADVSVTLTPSRLRLPSFARLRIVQASAIWPARDSPRALPHNVRARMSRSLSIAVITYLHAKKARTWRDSMVKLCAPTHGGIYEVRNDSFDCRFARRLLLIQ